MRMRRVLAFFLALYVIALTLDPCVDNEATCSAATQLVKETGTPDHGNSHQDLCSPFCTCNCCSLSMEVAAAFFLPATPVLYSTLPYFFEPRPVSAYPAPVWEPPKA